jgi:toxin ParE1/3/4
LPVSKPKRPLPELPRMFEVRITKGAQSDLEALHDYVAINRSAAEAAALLDGLLDKIITLEAFPLRGPICPELDRLGIAEFRQIYHSPYRLIYHVTDKIVYVMIIADSRRDMKALLERRILGEG